MIQKVGNPSKKTSPELQITFSGKQVAGELERNLLHSIYDSIEVALVSYDLDGIITFWNRGAAKMYGYTPEEAIGNSISTIIPPEFKDEIPGIIKRLSTSEKIEHYETVRLRKNGEQFEVSLSISSVRDHSGALIGVSNIARDMTVEEILSRQRAFLASVIETTDDAILTKDLNGIITSWNRGAQQLYGYKPEEVLGKHVSILASPESVDEVPGIMERLRRGIKIDHYETKRIKKNGEKLFVSLAVSPLFNGSGRVIGASAIARDITDQKKALDMIRVQLREKEVLLQEVHHRVKNNLQIISSLLELRSRSTKEDSQNPAFRESIERIRAMALIHEKLYQAEDLSAIDFAGYIGTLCRHLIRAYSSHGKNIHFSLKGEKCLLPLNIAVPLGLIFNELITNSLKYAFEGHDSGNIQVGIQTRDNLVRFLLSDDGIGLPEGLDISQITTFGFRIVRLLVDQIDGSIRNMQTKGATFEILLPLENQV